VKVRLRQQFLTRPASRGGNPNTYSISSMPASGLANEYDDSGYQSEPSKAPCKCGCKSDKSASDSSVPASPQFVRELDNEVEVLLERAKDIRVNGRQKYKNLVI
jgi:hypothetical protein